MNKFTCRDIYSQGEHVYVWEVKIEETVLDGSASSVRRCYRDARKAVKRYRKMHKFLNPS